MYILLHQDFNTLYILLSQGFNALYILLNRGFNPVYILLHQGFNTLYILLSQGFNALYILLNKGFNPMYILLHQGLTVCIFYCLRVLTLCVCYVTRCTPAGTWRSRLERWSTRVRSVFRFHSSSPSVPEEVSVALHTECDLRPVHIKRKWTRKWKRTKNNQERSKKKFQTSEKFRFRSLCTDP